MDLRYTRSLPEKPRFPADAESDRRNRYILNDDFIDVIHSLQTVLNSDVTDELNAGHSIIRQYDPNEWNFADTCSHCGDADNPLYFVEYHASNTLIAYCEACTTAFIDEAEAYVETYADDC